MVICSSLLITVLIDDLNDLHKYATGFPDPNINFGIVKLIHDAQLLATDVCSHLLLLHIIHIE